MNHEYEVRPSTFSACIGGHFGITYEVTLSRDGTLSHSQDGDDGLLPPSPRDIRLMVPEIEPPGDHGGGINSYGLNLLQPSREAWDAFRMSLHRAGFWDWDRSYSPRESICDGTSWSVEIEWEGVSKSTGGSNAYPAKWPAFRRALRKLLGGLAFD